MNTTRYVREWRDDNGMGGVMVEVRGAYAPVSTTGTVWSSPVGVELIVEAGYLPFDLDSDDRWASRTTDYISFDDNLELATAIAGHLDTTVDNLSSYEVMA